MTVPQKCSHKPQTWFWRWVITQIALCNLRTNNDISWTIEFPQVVNIIVRSKNWPGKQIYRRPDNSLSNCNKILLIYHLLEIIVVLKFVARKIHKCRDKATLMINLFTHLDVRYKLYRELKSLGTSRLEFSRIQINTS